MNAEFHLYTDAGVVRYPCSSLLTIGRLHTNHVVLNTPKVSRSHAMIRQLDDGQYYVMDTGSRNGVLVNDERVVVPRLLKDGDAVRVGEHLLVFHQTAADHAPGPESVDITAATLMTQDRAVQELTVLVADVRGYSSLSETLPVDTLAQLMAAWFGTASSIVDRHAGTVDKFIGDAIMVRWRTSRNHAASSVAAAVRTAVAFDHAAREISAGFADLPGPFRIGTGINTGLAVLGTLGADQRREFTALGDSVNLAFRLETASKELRTDVVIGPDSYRHLPKAVWQGRLSSIQVKGKAQPIDVCAITYDDLAAGLSSLLPA